MNRHKLIDTATVRLSALFLGETKYFVRSVDAPALVDATIETTPPVDESGSEVTEPLLAGEDTADDSGCETADFLDGPDLDETERDRPPDSPGDENGDTDERGDWPLSNDRLDPIGSSRHFPSPPDGVHDECQFVRAVVRHDWSRERP
jgi:hypothetical protein